MENEYEKPRRGRPRKAETEEKNEAELKDLLRYGAVIEGTISIPGESTEFRFSVNNVNRKRKPSVSAFLTIQRALYRGLADALGPGVKYGGDDIP